MKVAATKENKQNQSRAVANNVSQKKNNSRGALGFVDNRPETKALKSLQMMINNSPRIAAQRQRTSNITGGNAQVIKGPDTNVPNGPAESSKIIRLYAPSQVLVQRKKDLKFEEVYFDKQFMDNHMSLDVNTAKEKSLERQIRTENYGGSTYLLNTQSNTDWIRWNHMHAYNDDNNQSEVWTEQISTMAYTHPVETERSEDGTMEHYTTEVWKGAAVKTGMATRQQDIGAVFHLQAVNGGQCTGTFYTDYVNGAEVQRLRYVPPRFL
jgi:hypothetical protein